MTSLNNTIVPMTSGSQVMMNSVTMTNSAAMTNTAAITNSSIQTTPNNGNIWNSTINPYSVFSVPNDHIQLEEFKKRIAKIEDRLAILEKPSDEVIAKYPMLLDAYIKYKTLENMIQPLDNLDDDE